MDPTAVSRRSALGGGSRYELLVKIATGGTATVYVGRLRGSEGFSRLVAIKRAHPHLRDDPSARRMLVREATLASRIHHANVVPIHDVEQSDDELLLVMSYVEGGTLAELLEAASGDDVEPLPPEVALRIVIDACAGLSAVHELRDDDGRPLGLVHRDVSPQNVLVGVDGTSRLTDFGLAKVTEVSTSSTAGVQGKVAYLAPEYVEGHEYTQAADVFSLAVVAWEALSGRRLFKGNSDADTLRRVVSEEAPALSEACRDYDDRLDAVLAEALDKDPAPRTQSVATLSQRIAEAARPIVPATHLEVGEAVRRLLKGALSRRREVVRAAANPMRPDTISVLHDDLPIVDAGSAPAVTEPTEPLDASLFDDPQDAVLDAETQKLPAAHRPTPIASPSPPKGRPRWALAVGSLLVAAAAIAAIRTTPALPARLRSGVGTPAARVAAEAAAVVTASPDRARRDQARTDEARTDEALKPPDEHASSPAERTAAPGGSPPPPPTPASRPTGKRLPSNPYKTAP